MIVLKWFDFKQNLIAAPFYHFIVKNSVWRHHGNFLNSMKNYIYSIYINDIIYFLIIMMQIAQIFENCRANKKFFTIILHVSSFCVGACYSLPTSFFPKESERKNATSSEYGLIIGVYEFGMMVSAPFLGKLVSWFGFDPV